MKFVSWNLNGINASTRKGMLDFLMSHDADVYCFQELKASEEKIPEEHKILQGYYKYYLFAEKKGYSGVGVYSKQKPLTVIEGVGDEEIDREGRVLTLEYPEFFLINAYFPHTHRELLRLPFKMKFNQVFEKFCKTLNKPIIIASDFNVAHTADDLANPKPNEGNAGFTREEREWFTTFLQQGYVDTFREFTKGNGHYTWWTYRANARERNIGWRIDYFVVSQALQNKLKNSSTLPEIQGSDHCPIQLELN